MPESEDNKSSSIQKKNQQQVEKEVEEIRVNTSKGSKLIRYLIYQKENIKVLKVGLFLFSMQTVLFMVLNLLIYFLIQNQLKNFQTYIQMMSNIDTGMGTIQNGFMIFNYRYLINTNLIT